jgi:hypothetical protein
MRVGSRSLSSLNSPGGSQTMEEPLVFREWPGQACRSFGFLRKWPVSLVAIAQQGPSVSLRASI